MARRGTGDYIRTCSLRPEAEVEELAGESAEKVNEGGGGESVSSLRMRSTICI